MINGFNKILRTIKKAGEIYPDQEHFVSLIVFRCDNPAVIYNNVACKNIKELNNKIYKPCGGTPLYDSIALGIDTVDGIAGKDDIVLVSIITDGEDTSSKQCNAESLKNIISGKSRLNWIFTYIGANQNIKVEAERLSIKNYMSFDSDFESTMQMFEKESVCRMRFYDLLDENVPVSKIKHGYFE